MKDEESDEIRKQYKRILDKRFQAWEEKGTNLSPSLRDFLREVAERDWVRSQDERGSRQFAAAMSPRQRGYKSEVRRKLRSGLADLAAFASFIVALKLPGHRPRFREKDVEEILDLGDLLSLVRLGIKTFEETYADPILNELAGFYRRRRKSVMVYQTFSGGPPGFG